ncbi:hypothetical protein [Thomasclavelia sp.]|uniref:hypothetical protein n=1 Tax=Thomasclavelia sp. TaxID=3025757 RepID=UPI0025F3F779|nr:hypothetical protein [Thomasclavelia sp.]
MKKIFIYCIICLSLITWITGCSSNNDEGISQNKEETTQNNEKQETSNKNKTNEEQKKQENIVLLDQDNIYIEYRGIIEYSLETWMMNIYIENNKDSDVYIIFSDSLINQSEIGFSNGYATIKANSKYLSEPNFDFLIDLEDLNAYSIDSIDNLSFQLSIYTELLGDLILEKSIELTPNKSIN